jgi:hypothetical protein
LLVVAFDIPSYAQAQLICGNIPQIDGKQFSNDSVPASHLH